MMMRLITLFILLACNTVSANNYQAMQSNKGSEGSNVKKYTYDANKWYTNPVDVRKTLIYQLIGKNWTILEQDKSGLKIKHRSCEMMVETDKGLVTFIPKAGADCPKRWINSVGSNYAKNLQYYFYVNEAEGIFAQ